MQGKTVITVVMDQSGSMYNRTDQVVSGFNEFLQSQRDSGLGDATLTLIKFNDVDGIDVAYEHKDIGLVDYLRTADFNARGTTPLYDAIGRGIEITEEGAKIASEVLNRLTGTTDSQDIIQPLTIMVIITDGANNSSHKFTQEQIFRKVAELRDKNWSFVFIGAEIDTWAVGGAIGMSRGNMMGVSGKDAMEHAYRDLSQSMGNVRGAYAARVESGDLTGAVKIQAMSSEGFFRNAEDIQKIAKKENNNA